MRILCILFLFDLEIPLLRRIKFFVIKFLIKLINYLEIIYVGVKLANSKCENRYKFAKAFDQQLPKNYGKTESFEMIHFKWIEKVNGKIKELSL